MIKSVTFLYQTSLSRGNVKTDRMGSTRNEPIPENGVSPLPTSFFFEIWIEY